jgi:hypothetical protein
MYTKEPHPPIPVRIHAPCLPIIVRQQPVSRIPDEDYSKKKKAAFRISTAPSGIQTNEHGQADFNTFRN